MMRLLIQPKGKKMDGNERRLNDLVFFCENHLLVEAINVNLFTMLKQLTLID